MAEASAQPPRCFISYSWTNPDHEEWVLQLGTELRQSGIDVVLDKWDLREGQDPHVFMEAMITDDTITKVLLVCDAKYVERANERSGGVGIESQIISPKVYASAKQTKFVAVVRERDADGRALLPAYYGSRIYIDLSADDLYRQNFEQLVRWIFDKPVYVKPAIGKPPEFFDENKPKLFGNAAAYHSAMDGLKAGRPNFKGAAEDYLASVLEGLAAFRIQGQHELLDEVIFQSIESLTPCENQILALLTTLSSYRSDEDAFHMTDRFFEALLAFNEAPESARDYTEWHFDNFKFFSHELFLSFVAFLVRRENFEFAAHLLSNRYYHPSRHRGPKSASFAHFWAGMPSLNGGRNKRLELRRVSVHADLLKERCVGKPFSFEQMMQADFILYLRDQIDRARAKNDGGRRMWWPTTLLYRHDYDGAFEVFARSESSAYFDRAKMLLGVQSKGELERFITDLPESRLPRWDYTTLDIPAAFGLELLASRP
ncbi:SEFIR domain-containing protein [Mesorhizobium sp. M0408]|uniref:toll/interleukin-1 receptor domain-containing protein n=1 Tax=Mesorhizobium sp. M0408 TaxID=2956942 RepID=UPI0033398CDA